MARPAPAVVLPVLFYTIFMHTPSVPSFGTSPRAPISRRRRLSLPDANLGDFSQKLGSPVVASLLRVQRVGRSMPTSTSSISFDLASSMISVAQRVHAVGGAGHQDLNFSPTENLDVPTKSPCLRRLESPPPAEDADLDRRRATLEPRAPTGARRGDHDPLLESLQLERGIPPPDGV